MGARTNMLLESPIPAESAAPEYNLTERLEAAFELGMKDIFTSRQYKDDIYDELEQNDPIGLTPHEELNQRFPDIEQPFTKPTSFLLANELNEEAKEKKRLMNIISNFGKSDSFAVSLAGGLASHATDPVEAGIDIFLGLTTGGIGNAAKWGLKSGKLGARATKIAKRTSDLLTKSSLTRSITEGVVANAALEPYFMSSSERAQEDYGINDALISVIGGGVAFPAMAFGLKRGGNLIADNAPWMGQAIKSSMSQMASGKKPNLDSLIEIRKKHLYGVADAPDNSLRSAYRYQKLEQVDIPKQDFYVSTTHGKGVIDYNDHHVAGNFLGNEGIHITDNPNIANRLSNDAMQTTVGDIHQINLKDSNLYSIDNGFDEVADSIDLKLKEIDPELSIAFRDAPTVKEGLENVKALSEANNADPNGVLRQVHEEIESKGYKGVVYSEDGVANNAYIYKSDSINHKSTFKPDIKSRPKQDIAKLKKSAEEQMRSEDNNYFHNEYTKKDIDSVEDLTPENFNKEMINQVKREKETLKELIDSGFAVEDDIRALREIEIEEKMIEGKTRVFQKIKNCLLGNR